MDLEMIQQWNERFAIRGVAEVVAGLGGLAAVRVTLAAGSAEIYLHGAHLTSWRPAGGDEVIFLSARSRFEVGKAIRGGIPICFPWFRAKKDDAGAPQHGFARTSPWSLEAVEHVGDSVVISLALESSDATLALWPFAFRAVYRVTVGAELKLELAVTNTGDAAFEFEEALHTYHRVGDVERVRVAGLDGSSYLDNRDGNKAKVQAGDVVLAGAVDNAYLATESALEIVDPRLGRRVEIEKAGSRTTVVWNPWSEAAKTMADLGDEEWREFVCVEASNILSGTVTLGPGEEHVLGVTIRVT
jgi:glucose-6-phosphate 1-epimerase